MIKQGNFVILYNKVEALLAVAAYHQSPSVLFSKLLAIKLAMSFVHTKLEWKKMKVLLESDCAKAINFITGRSNYPYKN